MKNNIFLLVFSFFIMVSPNIISAQTNIDCGNAVNIYCGDMITGNNLAVTAVSTNDCGSGNIEVWDLNALWYKIIGDGSLISLSTCNSVTDFPSYIQLLGGECGLLSCLASDSNDDCVAFDDGSLIDNFQTVAGDVYYLIVSGFDTGDVGNFRIDMTCSNTPAPNAVEIIGNGPICEGDDAIFTIVPGTNPPTPGGIVSFDLDGSSGLIYLNEFGEGDLITTAPTSSVSLTLLDISNQNNGGNLNLGNSLTIGVNEYPEITNFEVITGNPGCEGQTQVFEIEGTPNADIRLFFNGIENNTTLSPSGISNYSTGFVSGTFDSYIAEIFLDGCTTNYTDEFEIEYTVNPTPEITSYTISPSVACEGEFITLTVTGTPNATVTELLPNGNEVTYNLDANGQDVVENFTTSLTGVNIGINTYTITQVSLNGCSTEYTTEFQPTLTVNEIPTVNSITAQSNPVCTGDNVMVWDIDLTTGATYSWSVKNANNNNVVTSGGPGEGSPSVTISLPGTTGSYFLELTDVTLNGCVAAGPFVGETIDYLQSPEVTSFTIAPLDICPGDEITIDAEGTPLAAFSIVADGQVQNFNFDMTGSFSLSTQVFDSADYEVTEVSSDGCTTTYQGNFVQNVVNTAPEVTSITSIDPACYPGNLVWNFEGTPGAIVAYEVPAGGISSTITLDGNGMGSPNITTIIEDIAASPLILNVTSITLNGCSGDVTGLTSSISVFEIPTITSFSIDQSFVCEYDTVTINAVGTPNAVFALDGISASYMLDNNGEFEFSNTANFFGFNSGFYIFSISDINLNGCSTSYTTEFEANLTVASCESDCYDFLVMNGKPEKPGYYETVTEITSASIIEDFFNCWDTNLNGFEDVLEDLNGDGIADENDCLGQTGSNVVYSSQTINLEPGFEVVAGTEFDAIIGTCPLENECGVVRSEIFTIDGSNSNGNWNIIENSTCVTKIESDPTASGSSIEVSATVFEGFAILNVHNSIEYSTISFTGTLREYIGIHTGSNGKKYYTFIHYNHQAGNIIDISFEMIPEDIGI